MTTTLPFNISSLVGLREEACTRLLTRLGKPFRVSSRNGEPVVVARDRNPRRVNLEVLYGQVTGAYFE